MLETIFEESFGTDLKNMDGGSCGKASGEECGSSRKDASDKICDEKCSSADGDKKFFGALNGKDKNERSDFYSEDYEWREFVYKNGEKFR